MESERIPITEEQLEILNTGRAFAALEQSLPYKAMILWIEGFERQATEEARGVMKSGMGNDAYFRACIRRDAANELKELLQEKIREIKDYAATIAQELKENNK